MYMNLAWIETTVVLRYFIFQMLLVVTENGATYIWRPGQVSQGRVREGFPLWAGQAGCQGARRWMLQYNISWFLFDQ